MNAIRGNDDIFLAMDTSGDVCSVAVLRNGRLFAEHTFRHQMHLSEHLMAHLDSVLTEAGCALADVAAFAVGIGPGSFTGTRVGVMTVKTLAVVQGVPIYGIDGLLAIAAEYAGVAEVIVPMLPCRADIVYAGIYTIATSPNVSVAPAAVAVTDLMKTLAAESEPGILFCGEAVERYRSVLTGEIAVRRRVSFGRIQCPRASVVGELAWQRQQSGDMGDDPLAIVPLYISPPPITMPKSGLRTTDTKI